MRLLRSFPQFAFALVLISIVGLCIAQQSVWLLLGAGAIAVASRTVTEGPLGRAIPRGVAAVLFVALAVYAAVAVVREGVPWITVLGHLALGLTLIKLYERRTPRDWGHLLSLSLLMMVIGTVQSADLLFGVVVVVYAGLGLHVLLLFQLYAAHEQAKAVRRSRSPRGFRLVPAVKPAARRQVAGHLHRLGVAIALVGLLVSGVVFVLMPRGVGRDIVPALRLSMGSRVGFADRIDLRTGQRITSRHRPVMDVRFEGALPAGPVRLRGAALDSYLGGGRWRATPRDPKLLQTRPPALTLLTADARGRVVDFTIDPFEGQSVLFSPMRPIAVSTADPEPLRFDPGTAILRRPGAPAHGPYVVRALVDPPESERTGAAPPGDLARLLDPAIRTLAAEVLAAAGLPLSAAPAPGAPDRDTWHRAAAAAFSDHLQARYRYTLDLSDIVEDGPAETDPVRRFLLDTQRGHCEYFASALAALCANVGIPARMITGYVAYEIDPGHCVVLESNAHAWCEVRTGPEQWTTVDPTPPATLEELHRRPPSIADRLSWLYERMEGTWHTNVVLFDRRGQQRLSDALDVGWGEAVLGAFRAVRAWTEQVNRAFRLGPAGYIWLGVMGFAVILAALALVRLLRRSAAVRLALRVTHRHDPGARRMVRQLGFYLDMLLLLERAGLAKPPSRPPRLHALALQQAGSGAGPIVRDLTDRFYAARYGDRPLTREQLVEAAGLLEELARVLEIRR